MAASAPIEVLADTMAILLDLRLSEESRAAVIANLAILFERAGDFADASLPDALDPAPLLRL